jgi:hypothetical protein
MTHKRMLEVATPSFSPSLVHTPKAHPSKKRWILNAISLIFRSVRLSTSEKVDLSTKNPTHKYKAGPFALLWLDSYFFEYNCKKIHISLVLNPDNKQHNSKSNEKNRLLISDHRCTDHGGLYSAQDGEDVKRAATDCNS